GDCQLPHDDSSLRLAGAGRTIEHVAPARPIAGDPPDGPPAVSVAGRVALDRSTVPPRLPVALHGRHQLPARINPRSRTGPSDVGAPGKPEPARLLERNGQVRRLPHLAGRGFQLHPQDRLAWHGRFGDSYRVVVDDPSAVLLDLDRAAYLLAVLVR